MKRFNLLVSVLLLCILFAQESFAQVGIGTESPTNTLHIKPTDPNEDPLRIENINKIMQGDSALLVLDPNTGVVRYLLIDSIFNYMSYDVDISTENELQNASQVPLSPAFDIGNDGSQEANVQAALLTLADKIPKGTFKSIGQARAAGLLNGDSFWADPKGLFGCSGCVITLHPGMN